MKLALLVVASGILLALCLPPYNVEWLGWVAVTPVIVATQGRRPLEAMGSGMVASAICGIIHVGWSSRILFLFTGYVPFLWLAILVGTVTLAASLSRPHLSSQPALWWVLFVASVGVVAEWVTTLSPLPLYLAACQYQTLPIIQIASLTGIWGVSFLLWWTNAALANAVLNRKLLTPTLGVTVGGLVLVWGYGLFSISQVQHNLLPALRVAAIQDYGEEGNLEGLTRQAVQAGAKFVVWPEEALSSSFAPNNANDPTRKLARGLKANLVVGYLQELNPKPFNCAALITSDGTVAGIHRKIHLFSDERPLIQPGHHVTAFKSALGTVGIEICYDSCFTDVTRQLAQAGAQIVAMPNYDPPTPHGILHHLHGSLQPFRAVENRVPFVRTDSGGFSQVVDATGRIIGQSPLFKSDILVRDVPLGTGQGTLFTRFGDWFAYACWIVAVVTVLTIVMPKRKKRPGQNL